jgi:two-component system NtrC family sensor kinase
MAGNKRLLDAASDTTGVSLPAPRVLVVDDVEANLIAVEALLLEMDCTVVRAHSGNEALRQLLKLEFAVMLLDVQMPGMDGYEVAAHVRGNPATSDVPIIFLTAARGDEVTALRAYGTGAVDFLLKPINATVLRSKVRVFLELRREREQLAAAKTRLELANAELEEAYRELQATQSQLIQSAKMASLGQLVAGVAHEINNPLAFCVSHVTTAIRSLAEVEQEHGSLFSGDALKHWERAQSRLSEMSLGLDRIADLVIKLRTFSRLDEGEFKQVSVSESINSLLTIVGHRMNGIQVQTSFGRPDLIACFPGLVNQAVMNLVVNAIDAMQGGGTLSIRAGASGDDYEIVVSDTGDGIPEELRERVFEPFFTTKAVGEGTGLGLSLAYSIIKKHGGSLALENQEPGTKATITLPLTYCAPAHSRG